MNKKRLLLLPVLLSAGLLFAGCSAKKDAGLPSAQSIPETAEERTTEEVTEEPTAGETTQAETRQELPSLEPPSFGEETVPPEGEVRLPSEVPDWDYHIVVAGDSRTVCLYCSLAYSAEEFPSHIFSHHLSETYSADFGNMTFVAKAGEGFDFFSTYGLGLASAHFDDRSVLVVWYGVNDPDRADAYITYMNNVSLQYGIPVYYMTVGPCNGGWNRIEPAVEEMNRKLVQYLRPEIRVIDTFSFIQDGIARGEFSTLDGVHYDYHTSQAVCAYVQQVLDADYAAGLMDFHFTGIPGLSD